MISQSSLQRCGRPIVVASHMRSGTHLMIDLLRRQFPGCQSWKWPGEPNDMLYLPLDVMSDPTAAWSSARVLRVLRRSKRPVLKTHWTLPDLGNLRDHQPDLADWIDSEATFLHVVRNPFNVLASQWAWDCSIRGIPPGRSIPDLNWIEVAISSWTRHYRIWSQRENVHLFRYEDITADPPGTVERLSALLGERPLLKHPLLPEKLRGLWHSRWNRLTGVRPASTEILTSGGAPAASDVFTAEAIELVNRIAGTELTALAYRFPTADGQADGLKGATPPPAPAARVNSSSSAR